MDHFEKMEKRLLNLPRQEFRTPDFFDINFKIQVAKLQQKTRRQTMALAAAFVLSTLAIVVSIQLAVKTAPAAVMSADTPQTAAVTAVSPAKSGENLESSGFEISWSKSEDIKNLAQAVTSAQWQIDTFNPITLQE